MKRLALYSLFLFIFASPVYAESGLVAYYNFNEGNGTVLHDRSGNGNDGTIYGATFVQGISEKALLFNGVDNYVKITSNNFKLQPISVELWIKTTKTESTVLDYENGDGHYGWELYTVANGHIRFNLLTSGGGSRADVYSSMPIADNLWHHVVATDDGASLKIYVDGNLDNSSSSTNSVWTTTMYSYLGATRPDSIYAVRWFNGTIDEVKIYNRTLTSEEIKAEYEKYAGDGLVAHYSFDEGNGTILQDVSGNGNDGTIYGATWTSGINGGALEFDGADDYVYLGNNSALYWNSTTLTEWLNFTETSSNYMWTLNDASGASGEWGAGIYVTGDGKIIANVGGGLSDRYLISFYKNALNNGGWHMITTTYNDTDRRLKLFIDGNFVAINNLSAHRTFTSADTLTHNPSLYSWYLGRLSQCCYPYYYKGLIDEVKIHNRALSPEEIKQEYEKYTKPAGPLDSDGDGLPDENETAYQLNPYSNDTDSDGINDFAEYSLLSAYLPVFQYTEETYFTEFYPQPIKMFLDYSGLYEFPIWEVKSGNLTEEEIAQYGNRYFLDFKGEEKYRLEPNKYKKIYGDLFPSYGYAVYMRAVPSSYGNKEYIVLQYWHHYLYNDYNFFLNKHEGDWEMAEILLDRATLEPSYAIYSQHIDSFYRDGGEIRNWGDVQKAGTHPFVYVARGSHASYFEDGNHSLLNWIKFLGDYTSSGGRTLGANGLNKFNQTIILRDDANPGTQKWLLYGGRWGERHINLGGSEKVYADGPVGPKYQGMKWDDPALWGLRYLNREMIKDYVVTLIKGGTMRVKNEYNGIMGLVNGTFVNNIPYAEFLSVDENMSLILPIKADSGNNMISLSRAGQQEADYTYTLEPNGTYDFELYLANETEAKHIVFYNVSGTSGTLDNVWIEGNKIYMNTTDGIKRLNAMLEYMTDAGEISTNLTGIRLEGDETLVIDVRDWVKINETGAVGVEATKNKCRLKDGCTKVIYHSNDINGLLLRILGPGQIELTHWNNRSGKVITK